MMHMVLKSAVLYAAILLTAAVLIPFTSFDDTSADSMHHVVFLDGDGDVLSEKDWDHRDVPFCIDDPVAPNGMVFIGWSTIEGSDIAESISPVESDTVYYPVFVPSDSAYRVILDPDNGIDSPKVLYRERDSTFTIPKLAELGLSVKYDRGPFVLNVWCTSDGTSYSVGDGVVVSEDIELKASWIRHTAVLPEFEEDLPDSIGIDRFEDVELSVSCMNMEGNHLTYEWFLKGDGSESSIATGPRMHLPGTMTSVPGVYTIYVRVTNTDTTAVNKVVSTCSTECTVTVGHVNILSVMGTDIVMEYPTGHVLDIPTIEMEGHMLRDLLLEDGTSVFDDDTLMMPSHDVMLIPIWDIVSYEVSYVSDGVCQGSDTIGHGTMIVLPDVPDKEGHRFVGWSYDGDVLCASSNVVVVSDMEFVAVWASILPVITVDGVTEQCDSITLGEDDILYWYDSDGNRYFPGETVVVKSGQTFTSVSV